MMSLTFGLFTQVTDKGPHGFLVCLFFFEGCITHAKLQILNQNLNILK